MEHLHVEVNTGNEASEATHVFVVNYKERFVANFHIASGESFSLPEGWEIMTTDPEYGQKYSSSLCNIDAYMEVPVTLDR